MIRKSKGSERIAYSASVEQQRRMAESTALEIRFVPSLLVLFRPASFELSVKFRSWQLLIPSGIGPCYRVG